MILRQYLATLLLAFAALPVLADSAPAPSVGTMSVQELLAWHDDVARRATTKDLAALSRNDREKLEAAQARIRVALAGKTSMADLGEDARLKVFTAHEQVIALVNKAEDERLVCKQTKRVGSHRHQLECRTVAQIKADREAARNDVLRTRTCAPGAGCGGN